MNTVINIVAPVAMFLFVLGLGRLCDFVEARRRIRKSRRAWHKECFK